MPVKPDQSRLLLPFRQAAARSLNVGLVWDLGAQPAWLFILLGYLETLSGITISTLFLTPEKPPASPPWLTDRLYRYTASKSRFAPFGGVSSLAPQTATQDSIDGIRTSGCDVLIWTSVCKDRTLDLSGFARFGVFTIRFGEKEEPIPFWDEVSHGRATSATTIFWHDASFAEGRSVRTAETSTIQGLYFPLNSQEPVDAAVRLLAALCVEVQQSAADKFLKIPKAPIDAPVAHFPSNLAAAGFAAAKLARSAQLRFKSRGKHLEWFLALRPNSGKSIEDPAQLDLSGFREVSVPPGVDWMADPFVWEHNGRSYLLCEQMPLGSGKGRLAATEVLDGGGGSVGFGETRVILERNFHLSYPCVVPHNGDLFLLPESSESGNVDLYRFTGFPWDLEHVATPIEGVPLVDTTPILVDGRWYIFTTTTLPFMETLLFYSDRLDGGWTLHPASPISYSVKNSRSAGQLFWKHGRLYRPTQDCSVCYGYAMQVNEVIRLTPTEFEEKPVNWIPPTWMPELLATHTWNESSRWQAIDGQRWRKKP